MQKLNKVITKTFDFNTGKESIKEIDLTDKNAIIDDNGEVLINDGKMFYKTFLECLDIEK